MLMVLSSLFRVIARVHMLHVMNTERRQVAAKLIDFSHKPTCNPVCS